MRSSTFQNIPTARGLWAAVVCCLVLSALPPAPARGAGDKPKKPQLTEFQKRVNKAIKAGADYLRKQQRRDGRFGTGKFRDKPGNSALCILALRKSGAEPDDPAIKKALPALLSYAAKFARSADKHAIYNCGASLLAIDSLTEGGIIYGRPVKRSRYGRAIGRLGGTIVAMQDADGGWGYYKKESHDMSNVQYALLGLWAVRRNGIKVPDRVWKKAIRYVLAHQCKDGGWPYSRKHKKATRSMTAAGIGCLAICIYQMTGQRVDRQLQAGTYSTAYTEDGESVKVEPPAGKPKKKREPVDRRAERAIEDGFEWFAAQGITELNSYYMYSMERACALTKTQKVGKRDWYKTLAQDIIDAQRGDGSWVMSSVGSGEDPVLTTCWNLLVLERSTEMMFGDYPDMTSPGESDADVEVPPPPRPTRSRPE